MTDLVIRNAHLVDGTGAPARMADIAIDGEVITAVHDHDDTSNADRPSGSREIDADGLLVTPGWVDVHTHYDGQATWDPELAPSSHHGVTTAVMGNCGVGFAPVRPDGRDFLIELMEGVEDIPGTALHEGIDWQWESFGEYLDALSTMHRTIDVGTQVPHTAVRAYVLGERAHEDELTADEMNQIAALVTEGVRAGGLGFSTSRTILHRSKYGLIPGTYATDDELGVIADALAEVGRGLFQYVSDDRVDPGERAWLHALSDRGVNVTYSMAQVPNDPDGFRAALDEAAVQSAKGALVTPQVPARPTGMLYGLANSFHPFIVHPTFRKLAGLPVEEIVRQMRTPEIRAALLSEAPQTRQRTAEALATAFHQMYRLGDPPDYEPPQEMSALNVAKATGRTPQEVAYDWLLEDDGKAMLFAPLGSYVDHNHDAIRDMISHPASVAGLSDGGAHCSLICDASFPTYLLTHWTRDRTRGEQLPLELVVHKQTLATARAYTLSDRGAVAPGMLADLNVIDHDALTLHAPHTARDLPANGQRILQNVDGYRWTIKAGAVTFEDGTPTGERPGRTLRATDDGIVRS